jgi:[acyl-carrier-protein] S-malonyltransferase
MMPEAVILCPGQGAQAVGMGRPLYDQPAAREIFDQADRLLGFPLSTLCFDGPDERLNQTDMAQPAIYTVSVACHAAALAAGQLPTSPNIAYAGLSLGEYTALHLAAAFDFETGLKLVALRGKYMQEAAVATPSTMVAVIGGDEPTVTKLCEENAKGDVLVPANFNAPGQIVVSGSKDACARFAEAASAAGLRAVPLTVAGAFHSPIMQRGADRMQVELERAAFSAPRSTVYSNVTAKPHGDVATIKRLLVDQIVKPVRWEQTMAPLANAPVRFVELAPGKVLAGLLKKQNRRAEIVSLG